MSTLRQRLDLVRHLVRRDFMLRYQDSTLGVLWSLVLPLAQLLVLAFLFQRVVPLGIEAYPAFVFCALLPWAWFSSAVGDAGAAFVGNRDLVRRPHFSPAVLLVVMTLSRLIGYLVSLPILFGVLWIYGRPPTVALAALPLLLVIQGTLILGLALLVATLNVFYRDVQHIVVVALSLLFYLTPVFYRPEQVTEEFHLLFALNPLVRLVEGYRAIFFHGTAPDPGALLFAAAVSAAVCLLGYRVYRRQWHQVVDAL